LRFDFFAFSTVFILPIPSALCGLLKVYCNSK
jgi:hypothetical protein